MSGHLLKITRERTGRTQAQLAEDLGMDATSVQGWESGRRPLTATQTGKLREVRRILLRLGADPALLVLLDEALDADAVLSHALAGPSGDDLRDHPLSAWVVTRDTTHMLAWALKGAAPTAIPPHTATTRRRGPVANSPLLGEPERRAVFAHMRRAAELGHRAGEDGALLRRQALYLCSYDNAPDTASWLAEMRRLLPAPRRGHWTPHWADQRSVAASLTRHGDTDTIHAFIADGMGELGETANLNYWAYWLGLDALPQADDTFMVTRPAGSWDGQALLRRLTDRLDPDFGCIDLNVHSVWSLLGTRRGLLTADQALNDDLHRRVITLLDGDAVSRQSRAELESVYYGLRLHRV
ncbi:helix-turn-helix domain-containing protein [Actinacidiphila soli]|uniref:helix-turn-helix domain-containing protein n=1 Tax=Actinacidiphila soli TaxID=2487275 RepID=UPI0013E38A86|nr:helix-turn-helix transcriptional regulator [Actinacidiphila soli]